MTFGESPRYAIGAKILRRIIADPADARIDQYHPRGDHQGGAIGRGASAGGQPDIAVGTRPVLNDHILSERRRKLGRDQPAQEIVRTARRENDDERDGPIRPGGVRLPGRQRRERDDRRAERRRDRPPKP